MDFIKDVNLAIQGDENAMERLYYNTYPKLRAVTMSILKNESDAEDIIQDTYIKAFSSLNQLDNASKFEAWLCRIASNKCKDYLKKHKPVLFSEFDNNEDDEPFEWSIKDDSSEYNPEEIAISDDTRRQLMELLDTLPDEQRICLVYYAVDEMKISEIAELLEVSENTVKSRLRYAEAKMKDKIETLEKKGVKIRSFAPFALFPFLRYLFATEAKAASAPAIPASIISESIKASGKKVISSNLGTAVTGTAVQNAKTVASHTIKYLGLKIAAGAVAVATIATVITVIVSKPNQTSDNEIPSVVDSSVETTYENCIGGLSNEELTELNDYLTFFSEQNFSSYPCDDNALYNFAYLYNKLNTDNVKIANTEQFEYAYAVDKSVIDSTLHKFFGEEVMLENTQNRVLESNVYYQPAADGEEYNYFSIAASLYASKDEYTIIFDTYEVLYEFDSETQSETQRIQYVDSGYMILKKLFNGEYRVIKYVNNDLPEFEKNFVFQETIPSNGVYYSKELDKYFYEGEKFPTVSYGDVYKDSYYEYHYCEQLIGNDDFDFVDDWEVWGDMSNALGWGVRVIDDTLESYPDIPHSIVNYPVISLNFTFAMCSNLKEAPQIPITSMYMKGAFYGCEALEKAEITIPKYVTNIEAAFMWCSNLKGTINILAVPYKYDLCFYNTLGPITLSGKWFWVYDEIINTAGNRYTPGSEIISWKEIE